MNSVSLWWVSSAVRASLALAIKSDVRFSRTSFRRITDDMYLVMKSLDLSYSVIYFITPIVSLFTLSSCNVSITNNVNFSLGSGYCTICATKSVTAILLYSTKRLSLIALIKRVWPKCVERIQWFACYHAHPGFTESSGRAPLHFHWLIMKYSFDQMDWHIVDLTLTMRIRLLHHLWSSPISSLRLSSLFHSSYPCHQKYQYPAVSVAYSFSRFHC